jgi:hypothetical protein
VRFEYDEEGYLSHENIEKRRKELRSEGYYTKVVKDRPFDRLYVSVTKRPNYVPRKKKRKDVPTRKEYVVNGRRKLYRLTSGSYDSKSDALEKAERTRRNGYNSRVAKYNEKYYVYYFN